MTNFKQTPRHVTLQHILLAKAATNPNAEVETHESARRSRGESGSDSDDFKTDTPSGSEKDIASSPRPIRPSGDGDVDVENISSDEGSDGGERGEESGEDGADSVSGFSSSSTASGESERGGSEGNKQGDEAENEVEILAVVEGDPPAKRRRVRSTVGIGYEETGPGQLDVKMKNLRPAEWVADELTSVKSIHLQNVELTVLAKRVNDFSKRLFKVEGVKNGENIASGYSIKLLIRA